MVAELFESLLKWPVGGLTECDEHLSLLKFPSFGGLGRRLLVGLLDVARCEMQINVRSLNWL